MKIKMRYVKWIWWGELKEKKKQVVYSFYQQAADQGQLVEGRTGEKNTHKRERKKRKWVKSWSCCFFFLLPLVLPNCLSFGCPGASVFSLI